MKMYQGLLIIFFIIFTSCVCLKTYLTVKDLHGRYKLLLIKQESLERILDRLLEYNDEMFTRLKSINEHMLCLSSDFHSLAKYCKETCDKVPKIKSKSPKS